VRAAAFAPPVSVKSAGGSRGSRKDRGVKEPNTIGLLGAIFIGLASMIGAGVFVVFHSAFAVSQSGYFLALALAAVVASMNSWAVYGLARQIDRPGGVYSYAREYVNNGWSFLAGFAFVFGKIGSIAAIALAFNAYVAPAVGFIPGAVAIFLLTLVNIAGISRTALMSAILAILTGGYLIVFTIGGFTQPAYNSLGAASFTEPVSIPGLLGAAALFFFAFAGYARIATLGNEVRNPKRNIPLAIVLTLSLVIVLYFGLAFVILKFLGVSLMQQNTPVAITALLVFGNSSAMYLWAVPIAALACLGSMLALLAGVSRTSAVMAEDHELPRYFARRNRRGVPYRAELVIGAGAIALTAIGDLTWVIGFSSFSVLFYYSVGHLAVTRQPRELRVMPRWAAWVGMALCIALALFIPGPAVPVSLGILVVAFGLRWFKLRTAAKRAVANVKAIAFYGTLRPGQVNHHEVSNIHGSWSHGTIMGELLPQGWGHALGHPGLVLNGSGPIAVELLESGELAEHLDRLDEFEGPDYERVIAQVNTEAGAVPAWMYVVRQQPKRRRKYGGSAAVMFGVNEIFQPSAANATFILQEKREERVALPSPEDKFRK